MPAATLAGSRTEPLVRRAGSGAFLKAWLIPATSWPGPDGGWWEGAGKGLSRVLLHAADSLTGLPTRGAWLKLGAHGGQMGQVAV